jgi:hypothetical protein
MKGSGVHQTRVQIDPFSSREGLAARAGDHHQSDGGFRDRFQIVYLQGLLCPCASACASQRGRVGIRHTARSKQATSWGLRAKAFTYGQTARTSGSGVATRRHDPPKATVQLDVVTLDLAGRLVLVEVERATVVAHLKASVASADRSE